MIINKDNVLSRCDICGEPKELMIGFPLMNGTGNVAMTKVKCKCKCDEAEEEKYRKRLEYLDRKRKVDDLKSLSVIDNNLKKVGFDTFIENAQNSKPLAIARRYVDRFDEMYAKNQGILLYGDVGTGKSYLAAAIANELTKKLHLVVMTSFVMLLDKVNKFEDCGEYINKLNTAELLVIDDLGAERGTDFALEKVYDVIDSRYRCRKPIILTTNIDLDDMNRCTDIRYKRIYDRLFEMCYPVKLSGLSWRKRDAVARMKSMKDIMEG